MESLNGAGMMMGPLIGGLLYQAGGFACPFFTCGAILIFCTILSALFLRGTPEELLEEVEVETETNYRILLKMPGVLLSCLLLILAEMSVSWYLPTLQPMLTEEFGLGPAAIGGVFMVEGGTYAIFSPLWGLYMDKKAEYFLPLMVGLVGVVVGFCLLATCHSLAVILIGLFIQG